MKAVGLHFAGAERGSVFSPIDKVLDALHVELAGSPGKSRAPKKSNRFPFRLGIRFI